MICIADEDNAVREVHAHGRPEDVPHDGHLSSGGFPACSTGGVLGAVRRAVLRHPLLCAHLSVSRITGFRWVAAADPYPYVDCADASVPLSFPGRERIDLRSETGLRVWAREGNGHTELRFQFHHACCDGVGAYRVIEDVLCAYDMAVLGERSRGRVSCAGTGNAQGAIAVRRRRRWVHGSSPRSGFSYPRTEQ